MMCQPVPTTRAATRSVTIDFDYSGTATDSPYGQHRIGSGGTKAVNRKDLGTQPALYIPHGGGPAFFMQGEMYELFAPMADHLASIAKSLPAPPAAILVVTAHWEASVTTLTGGASPGLIYDYGGFPPETYELTYPAPGDAELAARASALLAEASITNRVDPDYGWDHGVFIPLKVMFPEADIPVVAMSLVAGLDPTTHFDVGAALSPLRDEGVLIVGSGLSFHDLRRFTTAADDSAEFDRWLDQALVGDQAHRKTELEAWADAPSGRASHPREEHLIPLMVAAGAARDDSAHKTWQGTVGQTTISSWAFG